MREQEIRPSAGWFMLFVELMIPVLIGLLIAARVQSGMQPTGWDIFVWLGLSFLFFLLMAGFFIVEPGMSKVVLLFGSYKGTVKQPGFFFINPFTSRRPVSLRMRTFNGPTLKVNDLDGNPVEIAAVVVWAVTDTAKATFEVDNYEHYVSTQSETALRHLTSSYPYDGPDGTTSLRHNAAEVSEKLKEELAERLAPAGVTVSEARLSHLAYAPEIASAMLRRQQAAAVIAARRLIVEGAVGMVQEAIDLLDRTDKINLDDERKANMVTNLMVVLCSENNTQPVINAGSLYQ